MLAFEVVESDAVEFLLPFVRQEDEHGAAVCSPSRETSQTAPKKTVNITNNFNN
jgi:hypothetical protein